MVVTGPGERTPMSEADNAPVSPILSLRIRSLQNRHISRVQPSSYCSRSFCVTLPLIMSAPLFILVCQIFGYVVLDHEI